MKAPRLPGVPVPALRWALAAGLVAGVAYTLSPLTVLCAVAFVALIHHAGRGLEGGELRAVRTLLVVAVAIRVAAIAGLFAITDHAQVPFGHIFGDEEFFIRRSLWMRNIALQIPVSGADFIYVYDDVGQTSYLYVLGLAHILFGPSPYGVHLLSAVLYVGGCVVLFRVVRQGFGRPASLLGLSLLLFLPSLMAWSISVLKEPLFFAVMSVGVAAAVNVLGGRSWPRRVAAAACLVAVVSAAQSIREGGFAMATVGAGGGSRWRFSSSVPDLRWPPSWPSRSLFPWPLRATLSRTGLSSGFGKRRRRTGGT